MEACSSIWMSTGPIIYRPLNGWLKESQDPVFLHDYIIGNNCCGRKWSWPTRLYWI